MKCFFLNPTEVPLAFRELFALTLLQSQATLKNHASDRKNANPLQYHAHCPTADYFLYVGCTVALSFSVQAHFQLFEQSYSARHEVINSI